MAGCDPEVVGQGQDVRLAEVLPAADLVGQPVAVDAEVIGDLAEGDALRPGEGGDHRSYVRCHDLSLRRCQLQWGVFTA